MKCTFFTGVKSKPAVINSSFVEGKFAGTSKSCAEETVDNKRQNAKSGVENFIADKFW